MDESAALQSFTERNFQLHGPLFLHALFAGGVSLLGQAGENATALNDLRKLGAAAEGIMKSLKRTSPRWRPQKLRAQHLLALSSQWARLHPPSESPPSISNPPNPVLEATEALYRAILLAAQEISLQDLDLDLHKSTRTNVISLLVDSWSSPRDCVLALRAYQKAGDLSLQLHARERSKMIIALLDADLPHEAAPLLRPLLPANPWAARAFIRLEASLGSLPSTPGAIKTLQSMDLMDDQVIEWLLEARAKGQGGAKDAEKSLPNYLSGERMPTWRHYNVLIRAYTREGDASNTQRLIEEARRHNEYQADKVAEILMESRVKRQDLDGVRELLLQLERREVRWSKTLYRLMLDLCARRKDVRSAKQLVRKATAEGLEMDGALVSTYIDVLIAAEAWECIVDAFGYIATQPELHDRHPHHVFEACFKAFVSAKMPYSVAEDLLQTLQAQGLRPSSSMYRWLLRALTNAGTPKDKMHKRQELFQQLQTLSKSPSDGISIDPGFLMSESIRSNDPQTAISIYEEVRRTPQRVSLDAIRGVLWLHATRRTAEDARSTVSLVRSLMTRKHQLLPLWKRELFSTPNPVATLYLPAIYAGSLLGRWTVVNKWWKNLIEAGGQLSLEVCETVLDAFRRAPKLTLAHETWKYVFQKAVEASKQSTLPMASLSAPHTSAPPHVLSHCITSYVDILSTHGKHAEIASIWEEIHQAGFAFTPRNWNDLIIALIRAGAPKSAFEIAEVMLAHRTKRIEEIRKPRATGNALATPEVAMSPATRFTDGPQGTYVFRMWVTPVAAAQGSLPFAIRNVSDLELPPNSYWGLREHTRWCLKGALHLLENEQFGKRSAGRVPHLHLTRNPASMPAELSPRVSAKIKKQYPMVMAMMAYGFPQRSLDSGHFSKEDHVESPTKTQPLN